MIRKLVVVGLLTIHLTALSPSPDPTPIKLTRLEFRCLVDNVYHEAKGEPFLGQALVARTTLNRAISGKYPQDICKVVYQPKQFSWTSHIKQVTDARAWEIAAKAANYAYTLNNEALYFHNKTVKPTWQLTKTHIVTVGNHVFYK